LKKQKEGKIIIKKFGLPKKADPEGGEEARR
jgi:hypothetical protein